MRTERAVFLAGATFGLGSLFAIVLVYTIRVASPETDMTTAIALATALGYPAAAGVLVLRAEPDPPMPPARRTRAAKPSPEPDPIEVRVVDERTDYGGLVAGFRGVRSQVFTHRLRAERGEESAEYAAGYAAAVREVAAAIVDADNARERLEATADPKKVAGQDGGHTPNS